MPRVQEDREGWEQLRRAKLDDQACRACGKHGWPSNHLHHLVFRSGGGDDVPANLIPLCKDCHQAFHLGDAEVAQTIGDNLSMREIGYVLEKKGTDYLLRRYLRAVEEVA
jgi:hypothetical protein